jgi:hypothetical protein
MPHKAGDSVVTHLVSHRWSLGHSFDDVLDLVTELGSEANSILRPFTTKVSRDKEPSQKSRTDVI